MDGFGARPTRVRASASHTSATPETDPSTPLSADNVESYASPWVMVSQLPALCRNRNVPALSV